MHRFHKGSLSGPTDKNNNLKGSAYRQHDNQSCFCDGKYGFHFNTSKAIKQYQINFHIDFISDKL